MPCSLDPLTGFYRNGCCDTGGEDLGVHVVCVRVTEASSPSAKGRATTCRRRSPRSASRASNPTTSGACAPIGGSRRSKRASRRRWCSSQPMRARSNGCRSTTCALTRRNPELAGHRQRAPRLSHERVRRRHRRRGATTRDRHRLLDTHPLRALRGRRPASAVATAARRPCPSKRPRSADRTTRGRDPGVVRRSRVPRARGPRGLRSGRAPRPPCRR